MTASSLNKRIDPCAYVALADALAVIYWNKAPWARYLRGVFRDAPEVLSGIDFSSSGPTKRETAGELIDRLMNNEARYQALTIGLMLSITSMRSFPNLEQQADKEHLIGIAKRAVAGLAVWTGRHQVIAEEHERYAAEIAKASDAASKNRAFSAGLAKLRGQFLSLHGHADAQERGRIFEGLINQMFGLFDLEPRAAYSLERE